MYLVVIAWFYVVLLAALVEATSPTGTLLGAAITFVLYGVLPLSIVVYILGTPGRKRAIYAQAMAERAEAAALAAETSQPDPAAQAAGSVPPDADGKATAATQSDGVASVRKEP